MLYFSGAYWSPLNAFLLYPDALCFFIVWERTALSVFGLRSFSEFSQLLRLLCKDSGPQSVLIIAVGGRERVC